MVSDPCADIDSAKCWFPIKVAGDKQLKIGLTIELESLTDSLYDYRLIVIDCVRRVGREPLAVDKWSRATSINTNLMLRLGRPSGELYWHLDVCVVLGSWLWFCINDQEFGSAGVFASCDCRPGAVIGVHVLEKLVSRREGCTTFTAASLRW
jgi:hypothetical protein